MGDGGRSDGGEEFRAEAGESGSSSLLGIGETGASGYESRDRYNQIVGWLKGTVGRQGCCHQ